RGIGNKVVQIVAGAERFTRTAEEDGPYRLVGFGLDDGFGHGIVHGSGDGIALACAIETDVHGTADPADSDFLRHRPAHPKAFIPGRVSVKKSAISAVFGCVSYLPKSRTPAPSSTSSSMKNLPVHCRAGRFRIAWAASATISGLRAPDIISSPPSSYSTAAVAITVRGQREFTAIPCSANSAASARVKRLIVYLAMLYGGCGLNHFAS